MWRVESGGLILFGKPAEGDGSAWVTDVVASQGATLADLVAAVGELEGLPGLAKARLSGPSGAAGSCRGCQGSCCSDSMVFVDKPALELLSRSHLDAGFAALGVPLLCGPPCGLLLNHLCTEYGTRPLVCRLFLCTPMGQLLEGVIYQAIGALVAEAAEALLPRRQLGRRSVLALGDLLDRRALGPSYRRDVLHFIERWCSPGGDVRHDLAEGYDIPLGRLVDAETAERLFRLR